MGGQPGHPPKHGLTERRHSRGASRSEPARGDGSSPSPRPGPEGPPRICPPPPGADSVPHVGVSKDLRILVILRRCGCLVALGCIYVFSPQGRVGTAHHLAVGGGPWEDDVVSSFGLEERTGGLTAGSARADAQTRCFLQGCACQLPLPSPSPHTSPTAARPHCQAGMDDSHLWKWRG